jgi:hypothetical protein
VPEFRIEKRDLGTRLIVVLDGVIDENADLEPITKLTGRVEINFRSIKRINSFGVRAWINAIREIPANATLTLVECSPPVVDQINMVHGFVGCGRVESFFAPMVCEYDDEQVSQLFKTEDCKKLGNKLPSVACPRCGRAMHVDDVEDKYLLFVRDQR